jgi:hypothetical protein
VFLNLNEEYCIAIDAKCLVFLQFFEQTLVFVSRVPETQYRPLAKPHSCRAPYQVVISSSYPHRLFLVFWDFMLGM